MPGELFFEGPVSNWFTAPIGLSFPLQLREARWMREPRGVQDTLERLGAQRRRLRSYAADPITPAIEFAEHHPLTLYEARDAALSYVLGEGRSARLEGGDLDAFPVTVGSWVTGTEYAPDFFAEVGWDHTRSERFLPRPALPRAGEPDDAPLTRLQRVDTDVWHWAMVKSIGGPDLRDELVRIHLHDGLFRSVGAAPITNVLNFEAALPFLYEDFGPGERAALARAVDGWTAPKGLYSTDPSCPAFSPRTRSTASDTSAAGTARSGTTPPRGSCTRSGPSPRAPARRRCGTASRARGRSGRRRTSRSATRWWSSTSTPRPAARTATSPTTSTPRGWTRSSATSRSTR